MTPRVTPDLEAISNTLMYAPCWVADMLGPVPFGSPTNRRIYLQVQAILVETAEEAMEAAWRWVERACEAYDYPFDPDEWDCADLRCLNCN